MKNVSLFLATLFVGFSSLAATKKNQTITCINPKTKSTLVASFTHGEIVVTDKKGREIANIDSTRPRHKNEGTFTRVTEFVHEDGDVVLKIIFGDLSVQAYFDGQSFYCPRGGVR